MCIGCTKLDLSYRQRNVVNYMTTRLAIAFAAALALLCSACGQNTDAPSEASSAPAGPVLIISESTESSQQSSTIAGITPTTEMKGSGTAPGSDGTCLLYTSLPGRQHVVGSAENLHERHPVGILPGQGSDKPFSGGQLSHCQHTLFLWFRICYTQYSAPCTPARSDSYQKARKRRNSYHLAGKDGGLMRSIQETLPWEDAALKILSLIHICTDQNLHGRGRL